MEKHYTREELELYRHRQLSVLGRITCAAHLKECRQCAALLKELKEDDELVRELRSSLRLFDEISGTLRPSQKSGKTAVHTPPRTTQLS